MGVEPRPSPLDAFAASRLFCLRAGWSWEIHCDGPGPRLPEPWAIVTAWNPWGRPSGEGENRRAQARLARELLPSAPLRALGASRDLMHREPSLLARLTLAEALALARRYRQLAVFSAQGGLVRVVSTGGESPRAMGPYRLAPALGIVLDL